VRGRIDWKYALGLELSDPGFDYSVLSEFRARLLAGSAEERLLSTQLQLFQARGLVKAGGRQRTDSTHVVAVIRQLNRLELDLGFISFPTLCRRGPANALAGPGA